MPQHLIQLELWGEMRSDQDGSMGESTGTAPADRGEVSGSSSSGMKRRQMRSDQDGSMGESTGTPRADRGEGSGSSSSGMTRWVQEVNDGWKKAETEVSSSSDGNHEGDERGAAASRNSHKTGSCQPCVLHTSRLGCRNANCRYCHLSHPEAKRKPGLRTKPRERIQERIRGHFNHCRELQDLHEVLQAEAVRNSYAKVFIKKCLDEMACE